MEKRNLDKPAEVSFVGAESLPEIARAEGWSSSGYAAALAQRILHPEVNLSIHLERIQALAGTGQEADSWTAQVLAENFEVVESLSLRFALEAEAALSTDRATAKGAEIAERYLNASIKAQRAALGILSALKALRDAHSPSPAATSDISDGGVTSETD